MSSFEFESSLNLLIPKSVDVITNLLKLYSKKSRSETIDTKDIMNVFSNISQDDLKSALTLLNSIRKHKSDQKLSHLLPGQNVSETAQHIMSAMISLIRNDEIVPVDKMIKKLDIKDPAIKKDFTKEYNDAVKKINNYKKKNYKSSVTSYTQKVDFKIYLWARIGQFFFYGGLVTLLILFFKKLYEFIIAVKNGIFKGIKTFLNDNMSNSESRNDEKAKKRTTISNIFNIFNFARFQDFVHFLKDGSNAIFSSVNRGSGTVKIVPTDPTAPTAPTAPSRNFSNTFTPTNEYNEYNEYYKK
jgi:hypothetical protein